MLIARLLVGCGESGPTLCDNFHKKFSALPGFLFRVKIAVRAFTEVAGALCAMATPDDGADVGRLRSESPQALVAWRVYSGSSISSLIETRTKTARCFSVGTA
jgi:hypothetical protein